MFCPKCGTENEENAKFCKSCGTTFKGTPKKQKTENKKSSNNAILIAVTAIICVFIIAIGAFLVFGDGIFNAQEDSSTNLDTTNTDNVDSINDESSSDGMNFKEAAAYFPEASDTVLSHVFDEADSNSDGVLSDSEFKLFEKVRDHTKKYANNVKNEYSTVKPSSNDQTGYCADHGRVAVVDGNKCPYCIDLGYSDTRTKTSSW